MTRSVPILFTFSFLFEVGDLAVYSPVSPYSIGAEHVVMGQS